MHKTYPINIFKFCPHCAAAFDPQADNSFKCSGCGLHYYVNANAAVCALIEDSEGRLLLTKRARDPMQGLLDLPGGFVDPLESAEEALRREIKEELDIELTEMHYMGSFPNRYVFSGLTYFTLDLAFVCAVKDLSILKPADDVASILFLHPDRIDLHEIAFESIRNIIAAYCQKIKTTTPPGFKGV
jgi:8-oxo-dGTP pyrophosphatase MutT (NUDIX family)